ncbi:hypothetical protein SUGI_1139850 [Cryptomeria japonica]|nr:hypothetical protein SUGI_1139850 [Cryptomeria japonica]
MQIGSGVIMKFMILLMVITLLVKFMKSDQVLRGAILVKAEDITTARAMLVVVPAMLAATLEPVGMASAIAITLIFADQFMHTLASFLFTLFSLIKLCCAASNNAAV